MLPKQRFLGVLSGKTVDRTPVIIPGGMMAGNLYSLLQQGKVSYPDLHLHAESMAKYAILLQETCELDNYGVPFCMTVEAEDFGADVDLGTPLQEPRVTQYPAKTLDEVLELIPIAGKRHHVTLEAISRLAGRAIPVVGNIIGPSSLLTSLLEPSIAYRAMVKEGEKVAAVFELLSRHLTNFAKEQVSAGATVITIADPSSSGEIIGDACFRQLVAPALSNIVQEIKDTGAKVILHICGNIMAIVDDLAPISWDALSVDSVVSLTKLQGRLPMRTLMGNVSTHLLAVSEESAAYKAARHAAEVSAILAPACGLSTKTLPQNIRSMARAARDASIELSKRY
jgi:MtaA/CmuA family methyltransferase